MEHWVKFILYGLFLAGVLWLWDTLATRAKVRRQSLTTKAARFGLFVNWITTAIALALASLGGVGFYNATTPIGQNVWIISGGLCVAALVVWLLGRGVYFVLAGTAPDDSRFSPTPPPPSAHRVNTSVPLTGKTTRATVSPWTHKDPRDFTGNS